MAFGASVEKAIGEIPTEENTLRVAQAAAGTGVEYYVIDCGWHNEEDGDKVYPFVGQWRERRKL